MSAFDAQLQYIIIYLLLPVILLCLVAYYVLGFRKAKFEAFMCNLVCGWVHRKYCDKEKRILFDHMTDQKSQSKGHFDVLEIGAGSGMNFKSYPKGTQVTCLDPNPHNEHYLRKNAEQSQNHIKLVGFIRAFAENMPEAESDAYDAVLCTFTLCTVRNPTAVLKEIRRVLKPGGTFYYIEHVAGQRGSIIRAVQNKLQLIWPYLTSGCSVNRETWTYLDKSDLVDVQYRHYSANTWLGFFFRPFLYGTAVKG